MAEPLPITVAITGASGAPYALRLLQCLLQQGQVIDLLVSDAAREVMRVEMGLVLPADDDLPDFLRTHLAVTGGTLRVWGKADWLSPVASGSAPRHAMVICPASMGVVSAIAHGASNNLIERAADVCLKEGRKLVLVPRETPLSAIHLENLLALSRLGVAVLPAMPGFYHQPQTVNDLVDFIVARILSQLGLPQQLLAPWGEPG